jgi:hypothetical protein
MHEPHARGQVVVSDALPDRRDHDTLSRVAVARRLAQLLGYAFSGATPAADAGPAYHVPGRTLAQDEAAALGITGERDLLGGVVPWPFVATKVVSHGLVGEGAAAPDGWAHGLAGALAGVVLPGYSVFDAGSARRAGHELLASGPVRIKAACAAGGSGQWVAADAGSLDRVLAGIDGDALCRHGLVLERHLVAVSTVSIGQLTVPGARIAYHGTQQLATDHRGQPVYGGSDIVAIRGTMADLLALELPPATRLAIDQAIRYDAAMQAAFPGLFASRRNYDVAVGTDAGGRVWSGVLEQSWRLGGASAAEVAVLESFAADPSREVVRAATREAYGPIDVPRGAVVHYQGVDREVGHITKYSQVEPHGHPA